MSLCARSPSYQATGPPWTFGLGLTDATGTGGLALSPDDLSDPRLESQRLVGTETTLWLIHTSKIIFVFCYSEIENLALTVKEKAADSLPSVCTAARARRSALPNHDGAEGFHLVWAPIPD